MPAPDVYGRHMTGFLRLDLAGRLTRGIETVATDVYHVLITPRGTLPMAPGRGLGLMDLTLEGLTNETMPAIASDIEGELSQDDRLRSSEVTVSIVGAILFIDIALELFSGQAFRLVGPLSSVRVELINGV